METAEEGDIPLDADHFPDGTFLSYVKSNFDKDDSGDLSSEEREAVKSISVQEKDIKSLEGLQYFPNLEVLYCYENQLSSLDVSQNANLTLLSCFTNQLSSLDLSQNVNLNELYCYENQLSSLDVSQNVNLTKLYCYNNQLRSLDLSQNVNLTQLFCYNNQLSSLDVSKNANLEMLNCSSNQLCNLDVSKNAKLEFLNCSSNRLSDLDVSKHVALRVLSCSNNYLCQLYLPTVNHTDVVKIDISNNLFASAQIEAFANGPYGATTTCTPQRETAKYVEGLYTNSLGRQPAGQDMYYWYNALMDVQGTGKKMTGIQVASAFVFSPECSKRCVSDGQYITMLYQSLMGRTPHASEVNYWKSVLNSRLSRQYVFKFFAESEEYTKICETYKVTRGNYTLTQARDKNPNLTKYVNRLYVNALGRNGDIDGLNYWCNAILTKKTTPVAAAENFILSPEFTKKNLNNTEYVKVLYRTFMGREADNGGLTYWVNRLNKGESRRTILKSFAGCAEFKKIVADFGL